MAGSPAERKVMRTIAGILGALVIVAGGIYVPLALSRDVPLAVGVTSGIPESSTTEIALPEAGSSALRLGGVPLAGSGEEPRPIAGAAKIVTALVVLDAFPLEGVGAGPSIPITPAHALRYRELRESGARTVRVAAGEIWHERDALQAMLLGSSNNHAELLAEWAFGSTDAYITAATTWLAAHDLNGIRVMDASGLSPDNVGVADDMAALTELALGTPLIADIMADASVRSRTGERIQNEASYLPELGVRALSRSYTDPSGICLLFAIDVDLGAETVTVYGAVLGSPSYPTLERDMTALAAAAAENVTEVAVVEQGDVLATYETAWGEQSHAVAAETVTIVGWRGAAMPREVTTHPIGPTPAGVRVGEVVFDLPSGERSVRLVLSRALHGPDPFWLLSHPLG
ncbi:hypothetical protein [Diaminobutyricimonas sp. TR449]|uniref:hypothetical protein n=1 Tax=Diaminobutyricimonas sp. TR449 TaxID=2708076 RepID=UPI001422A183|nr:hypothetical protein [Diaminobutyricimonas sp. TR449]